MNDSIPAQLGGWYDAHAARLVLCARQWLDQAVAEDVVQASFLRLASQPQPPTSVKAWLFTAVRNAAISEYRQQQRRSRREQAVSLNRPDWFESNPGDLIDAKAAQEALVLLPASQREIILLRIWGGLSVPEAAEVLSEPVSTLFSRYRAGLAALRQRMESSCRTK
jgi:RNA polymerase sigma-70 factor (ECF subfamily)